MQHTHPHALPPAAAGTGAPTIERLIRLPELLAITGESRSKCYDGIKAGAHPAPLKDGRASAWLLSEVQAYVASKISRLARKGD